MRATRFHVSEGRWLRIRQSDFKACDGGGEKGVISGEFSPKIFPLGSRRGARPFDRLIEPAFRFLVIGPSRIDRIPNIRLHVARFFFERGDLLVDRVFAARDFSQELLAIVGAHPLDRGNRMADVEAA